MSKRILSVGQCQADHSRLSATLRKAFDVEVIPVDDAAEAERRLERESFELVLVNRVFDRDAASGLDFIRHLRQSRPQVSVMLVSNYPEAQQEAEAVGALPGFGKALLGQSFVLERLRPFLG